MAVEFECRDDPYIDFMNLVVECQIRDRPKPIFGKLVKLAPQYVTLRRRYGAPTVINRDAILVMQPTAGNPNFGVV